jgi:hypothetical protein
MRQVSRQCNAPRFRAKTERRVWRIVQTLYAQGRNNPAGPWTPPRSIALLAARQFRHGNRTLLTKFTGPVDPEKAILILAVCETSIRTVYRVGA